MGKKIRDLMTTDLVALDDEMTVTDAARFMREEDVGDVLVLHGGKLAGIVTDRDIVVRCIANGGDPESTPLERVCSNDVVTRDPDEDADEAVRLMQGLAVRRIPVLEDGLLVGIVSLGDLAQARDPKSALGQISEAPPNR